MEALETLRTDLQAGRIGAERLLDLLEIVLCRLDAANRRIEELEKTIGGGTPKLDQPFSMREEEKRQEARGKKKKRKPNRKERRGRLQTQDKIAQAERTEPVFPNDVPESDCSLSHTRVAWQLEHGRAVLIAYQIYRGFKNQYGRIPGVLGRSEFGLENVAGFGEYRWMAGNYIKYAGPLTAKDLPVDAHELVAMCARRPVSISVGSLQVEGGWVDARGMFMAGAAAEPVYKLLGKKGLGTSKFPKQETALVDGEIAFRQHAGGHTTGPNWPTFLKFADRYLKGPTPPATKPPTAEK